MNDNLQCPDDWEDVDEVRPEEVIEMEHIEVAKEEPVPSTEAPTRNQLKKARQKARKVELKAQERKDSCQIAEGVLTPESLEIDDVGNSVYERVEAGTAPRDTSQPPPPNNESRELGLSGYGTFAIQNITRGELIMSCVPVILNTDPGIVPPVWVARAIEDWRTRHADLSKAFDSLHTNDNIQRRYARVWQKKRAAAGTDNDFTADFDEYDHQIHDLLLAVIQDIADRRPKGKGHSKNGAELLAQARRMFHSIATYDSNRMLLERAKYSGSALCFEMARINHCCRPNAIASWDGETNTMAIRALRPIKKDKQITISYAPEGLITKDATQNFLTGWYGFQCKCKYCTGELGKNSAAARVKLSDLERKFVERLIQQSLDVHKIDNEDVLTLQACDEYMVAYRREFFCDIYLGNIYAQRAGILASIGRVIEAAYTLKDAYQIAIDCYGFEHPQTYQRSRAWNAAQTLMNNTQTFTKKIERRCEPYMSSDSKRSQNRVINSMLADVKERMAQMKPEELKAALINYGVREGSHGYS